MNPKRAYQQNANNKSNDLVKSSGYGRIKRENSNGSKDDNFIGIHRSLSKNKKDASIKSSGYGQMKKENDYDNSSVDIVRSVTKKKDPVISSGYGQVRGENNHEKLTNKEKRIKSICDGSKKSQNDNFRFGIFKNISSPRKIIQNKSDQVTTSTVSLPSDIPRQERSVSQQSSIDSRKRIVTEKNTRTHFSLHIASQKFQENCVLKADLESTYGSEWNGSSPIRSPNKQIHRRTINPIPLYRSPDKPVKNITIRTELPKLSPLKNTPTQMFSPIHSTFSDITLCDTLFPTSNEIHKIADKYFGCSTGLSDDEIKKILNAQKISMERARDYKKKIELRNQHIKYIKETLKSLLIAKNIFQAEVSEFELSLQENLIDTSNRIQDLEKENEVLKNSLDEAQCQVSLKSEKVVALDIELKSFKEKLSETERAHIQTSNSLVSAEEKLKESIKLADELHSKIELVEASKAQALKQERSMISSVVEKGICEIGIDVNKTHGAMDEVKRELDHLREKLSEVESAREIREKEDDSSIFAKLLGINNNKEVMLKKEICRLNFKLSELEDSEADAVERLTAKDKDLSELMKCLNDIQKSGQAREDELKSLRARAEAKVSELESVLFKSRNEINLLKNENESLKKTIEDLNLNISAVEKVLKDLKSEVVDQKEKCNHYSVTLQVEKELRARAEEKEVEERNERVACSAQMFAMTKEHEEIKGQFKDKIESLEEQWRERFESKVKLCNQKEKDIIRVKEIITGLNAEKKNLIEKLNDMKNMSDTINIEEIGILNGELSVLKERLRKTELKIADVSSASTEQLKILEKQLRDGQDERRRMHNIIQELRGNVRVFARIRPFLPGDDVTNDAKPCVIARNENTLRIARKSAELDQVFSFQYNRVFSPCTGQDTIFEEVSEFVQSALDGYNVCLFSYGQTGSGKTHTMQGSGVDQMRGIIPRAIEQVGRYKDNLEREGWQYNMKVSFLEIYNEEIRDLLRKENSEKLKHEIKSDSDGRRFVTNLTLKSLELKDSMQMDEIMHLATKHRSVGRTNMNNNSSRSHSVFTLHLTAKHPVQRKAIRGTLNLVDLAGSERLSRSGATGDRAKETMSINKSLSSLTDVFVACGKKSNFIPYRNSKLTYLLQPSLSGNGKTLMIVNVSPTEESFQETLCALRFAANVNKCELGKPKRSIEDIHATNDEKRINLSLRK